MKTKLTCLLLLIGGVAAPISAQTLNIDWSTIDGGGGTSTGGAYAISGTIGQPDVGRATGGNYTLVGGFWGLFPDSLPSLKIQRRMGNLVLSWPASETGIVVQSATQLPRGGVGWSNFTGEPTRVGDQF